MKEKHSGYLTTVQFYKSFRSIALGLVVVLFLMPLICTVGVKASEESDAHREKVLFISSYNSAFPTFDYQYKGVKEILTEDKYQVDLEFMDTKRFYTKENLENFDERIRYRLDKLEIYDAIIVGDDNALQYAMDHEDYFTGIPVVFLGINDHQRALTAYKDYNYTGVVEIASIKDTLDLSLDLYPEAKELVIISDSTPTGISETKQVMEFEKFYEGVEFRVEDLREISYSELANNLEKLDDDSVLLLMAAYSDVNGESKSFYEYLDMINSHADIPVFHLYNFGFGYGILGGYVVNYESQGLNAAMILEEILKNDELELIEPVMDTSLNTPMVDYEIMEKYKLNHNVLPLNTLYINKPVSLFEENKELVLGVAAAMATLIIIIILLIFSIMKRKKAEEELQNSNEELAGLYEQMMAINEELEAQEEEIRDSYENLQESTKLLEDSEERYKYVFDLSHSGMWERNVETKSVYMTKDWYKKLLKEKGYKNLEKLGVSKLLDLFYNQLDNVQLNRLQELQSEVISGSRASYTMILQCCKKGDKAVFVEEKAKAIYNSSGELSRIVGSHTNITTSVVYEQQLEEFAYKDQLTRMPNRIILEQRLDSYLSSVDKEIVAGSVLLIDVDNFKFINNTFGHEIGDELLQQIAKRLNDLVGEDYILGRISGDEFVILANNLHNQKDIELLANQVLMVFDSRFKLRERSIYITVSLGIATYPDNGSDLDTLLNRCNNAVHEAKIKGKNRYDFYDISMNESMENRIYIQNNIRQAIEKEIFMLFYQPIYSFAENEIIGFEALIRWKDDTRGYIPPDEFIVIAEKMGLINTLGDWVMRTAAAFIKDYNKRTKRNLYVSINVSSVQLLQKNFVASVLKILEEVEVKPSNVCIELTETALMQSFEKNTDKLVLFRDKGIRISLDDFGTGYSSLNYLRRLPVDVLKIDKSFVDEIVMSKEDRQLIEGIILLAQKMGIYVIAEGIEEAEQLNHLKVFNCDGIQGYYISRPVQKDDLEEFIESFKGLKQ